MTGFVAALALGLFLPVYTDEVGWRFQERAGFDGVDKLFNDICGPNTLAAPPWFMLPARHFSATLNALFADPFYVRVSGVFYAALLAALTLAALRRAAPDRRDRHLLGALGFGLIGLGMLPLLAVWSRPEQPILLCALAAMILALAPKRPAPGKLPAWLPAAALVVLWTIAVSYHLKALFLLPVFAVCLVYATPGKWPRLASGSAILGITAVAAAYWQSRLDCPESALLRAEFAKNSMGGELSAVSSLGDLWALVLALLRNMGLFDYVVLAAPNPMPPSGWLPYGQISQQAGLFWFVGLAIAWGLAALAGLMGLGIAARTAAAARKLDRRLALALAIAVTLAGWSAMQKSSNVYEAPFFLILLMLAVVLALSASEVPQRLRGSLEAFTALLALLALANPVAMAAIWGPALARSNAQAGYIAEQPYSVGLRGYPALRERILATARLCGIAEPRKAHGLLLDDVTYFAYMESRLPSHRLGVLAHVNGKRHWNGEIDDPVAYLKSRHSDGMLLGCHMLKPELRARARQNGPFCCIAPPGW